MDAQELKVILIMPWRCSWADRAIPVLEKGRFSEERKTVKIVSLPKPHLLITLSFPIVSKSFFGSRFLFWPGKKGFFMKKSGIWKATLCLPASQWLFSMNHPALLSHEVSQKVWTGLPQLCLLSRQVRADCVMRDFSKKNERYCKRLQTSTWHLNSGLGLINLV